ncbi:MAG TPA: IS1182 family transposase [Thermomicrobiales bacterium]|jgi:transposase
MGSKERAFGPLPPVSLDDLIPSEHFYRHLERTLDLGFVRELVRGAYADTGRPSIDPVVFFKLQLVLFFEGLRSERQFMRVVADRLSLRWYLGYDLTEPLPDHSSLNRLRDRYGLDVFRRFFEAIVEQCIAAGLVWGKELYVDATKVAANASLDSITPRFAVEAHLGHLFIETEAGGDAGGDEDGGEDDGGITGATALAPTPLPVALTAAARADLAAAAAARHDWIGGAGRPDRGTVRGHHRRTADYRVSTTDPDASPVWQTSGRTHLGFHDHYVVDGGEARIVLAALVTPAEVMENQPMQDLLWRVCFRWKLRPRLVTGDTTYGTLENTVAVEDGGIRAYVPLPSGPHPPGIFRRDEFADDPATDSHRCPGDQLLTFRNVKAGERVRAYQAEVATCRGCALRPRCTTGASSRRVHRSYDEAYLERVRGYHATPAYQKAIRKRQVWVEPLFAEAKDWHGLRRFRLRGLEKVNGEALLVAAGQNLKRLLSRAGWGRRPWPSGAAGVVLPAARPAPVPVR